MGGPDWGKVPGKKVIVGIHVSPTVADNIPYYRNPINLPPSAQERCLIGAITEVAIIKQHLPHYIIRAFDNPNACAGQVLTITGEHFGKIGLVVFPGVAQPVAALAWSETTIRVMVPNGAAPGTIRLSIFEQRLQRCGKDFDIYRPGDTLPEFTGGVPQILSLWVNNVQGDTSAEPNTRCQPLFRDQPGQQRDRPADHHQPGRGSRSFKPHRCPVEHIPPPSHAPSSPRQMCPPAHWI